MKYIVFILAALFLTAATTNAQERASGQSYDAQVNWSALSNKIDAISTQNKILSSAVTTLDGKIGAMTLCQNQKMYYAPNQNGHDANGCVVQSYGGVYMIGGGCGKDKNTKCRYANPLTGACSCPTGYAKTAFWEYVSDVNGIYSDNQGNCAKTVMMFQCSK